MGNVDAGADAAPGGTDAAQVTLKLTWWGSPDRAMRTEKVVEMFEAQNPGVTIDTEYFASTQSGGVGMAYWPTLLKYQADKTLPDIMQHDYAYIEEWTARGDLLELDPLVADKSLILDDVPASLVDGGRVGGKLMGVSLGSNTQVMAVDTDLFAQHNITLPTDEWTWEDFERIVLEIKTKTGGWGAGGGLHNYTPGWKAVYLSSGKWVFSPDGKSLGYTDDAPWADHFAMLLRLQDQGAIPQLHEERKGGNIDTDFIVTKQSGVTWLFSNQLVAMWNAANMASGAPRNFKLLPVPKVKGGISPVYLKPSQYFSVTATSKHPKESAKFIDFFTNDIEANKVLAGERGVPINTKVLAALKATLSKEAAESFAIIERATTYAQKTPPNDPPGWTTILNQILTARTIPGIMYKVWTPAEGTARFRAEANQVLMGGLVPDGGGPDLPPIPDAGADASGDAGDAGVDPNQKRVLLVTGAAMPPPADAPLVARLAALGLAVDVVEDINATTEMATGKALVVISATVDGDSVGAKFVEVPIPVILLEPNLFDEMGYTAALLADHDTISAQTQVTIATPADPRAAGLTGTVTVYTEPGRMVYGVPGPGAVKIATIAGNADQSTIFGYDKGAMMVERVAPAKRLAFFLHSATPPATLNADGTKLLDAAITWSLAP